MWPGQVKVLDAGLLDVGRAGFAVEMPTSAGKTALMMMAIAATLDASEHTLVVVLSPTRGSRWSAHRGLSSIVRSSRRGSQWRR